MPQKQRIGTTGYLEFIRHSVRAFGVGRVMSLIIVGLEKAEHTLCGVKALCEIGCMPVLSPFRPALLTPLSAVASPSEEFLTEVLERSDAITRKYGLSLGPKCGPCDHNTLTSGRNAFAYTTDHTSDVAADKEHQMGS
jgi:hypothetical protein